MRPSSLGTASSPGRQRHFQLACPPVERKAGPVSEQDQVVNWSQSSNSTPREQAKGQIMSSRNQSEVRQIAVSLRQEHVCAVRRMESGDEFLLEGFRRRKQESGKPKRH